MVDSKHNKIIELRSENGEEASIIRIFGSGKAGNSDGAASEATFNRPQGMTIHNGYAFVADTENHTIRRIDLETGNVKTIAGNGKQSYARKYKGNPLEVALNSPWDLVILDESLYIAMAGNHQIWRFDLRDQSIENFAGSGIEDLVDGSLGRSAFAQPSGIATDGKRLYVADSEVSAIRQIHP